MSAWGTSWGASWSSAWHAVSTPPIVVTAISGGGGSYRGHHVEKRYQNGPQMRNHRQRRDEDAEILEIILAILKCS